MCLIVHQPAGASLTTTLISEIHASNPDGFGVMSAIDGAVSVRHVLGDLEEVCSAYTRDFAGKPCVLHFRRRTHGKVDAANCHPYRVTDGIWLAHNGVLACGNPVSRNKSDTWHFVEFFLRPLLTERPATLLEQGFQRCLADLIGPSNRLALMQSDGRVVIINRRSGFEHRGIWFSNDYSFDLRRLSA